MGFTGILGSPEALSLANVSTMTAAGAGVLITVAATVWTYHAWRNYEIKAHRKKIEAVNLLYEQHLKTIIVDQEIAGFPPIFKLSEQGDAADALHFTDEEIRAVGDSKSLDADIVLAKYRQHISSAILKLKKYYLERGGKKTDTTSGVLAYLLYMLEKKCFHFEGYTYDIAYLNAINNFINAYRMSDGGNHIRRREMLSDVYSYLDKAKEELVKHQNALSLEDLTKELNNFTVRFSEKLLRDFVKLIVPHRDWSEVPTATMDELSDFILSKPYVSYNLGEKIVLRDAIITIPESLMRTWFAWMLNYYEESISRGASLDLHELTSPTEQFKLPDWQVLTEFRNRKPQKFTDEEYASFKEHTEQLASLKKIFKICDNFVTMKLEPKTAASTPDFIPVTDEVEMLQRAKFMMTFATLIHQMISLEYLCVYLLESIKQLGEIYTRSPQYFSLIFTVLVGICDRVKASISLNQKAIEEIQRQNRNTPREVDQQSFPNEIIDKFEVITEQMDHLISRISNCRHPADGRRTFEADATRSVKKHMVEIALQLAEAYDIPHPARLQRTHSISWKSSLPSSPKAVENQRTMSAIVEIMPKSFWEKHRDKILGGVLIAAGLLAMSLAMILTVCSGGALSLVGAVFGLAVGMVSGLIVDTVFVMCDHYWQRCHLQHEPFSMSTHKLVRRGLGMNEAVSSQSVWSHRDVPIVTAPTLNIVEPTAVPVSAVVMDMQPATSVPAVETELRTTAMRA